MLDIDFECCSILDDFFNTNNLLIFEELFKEVGFQSPDSKPVALKERVIIFGNQDEIYSREEREALSNPDDLEYLELTRDDLTVFVVKRFNQNQNLYDSVFLLLILIKALKKPIVFIMLTKQGMMFLAGRPGYTDTSENLFATTSKSKSESVAFFQQFFGIVSSCNHDCFDQLAVLIQENNTVQTEPVLRIPDSIKKVDSMVNWLLANFENDDPKQELRVLESDYNQLVRYATRQNTIIESYSYDDFQDFILNQLEPEMIVTDNEEHSSSSYDELDQIDWDNINFDDPVDLLD